MPALSWWRLEVAGRGGKHSHVLPAMGLSHEVAHGSLRMTLGRDNTAADIDYVLEVLPPILERLRKMSPLYERPVAGAGPAGDGDVRQGHTAGSGLGRIGG